MRSPRRLCVLCGTVLLALRTQESPGLCRVPSSLLQLCPQSLRAHMPSTLSLALPCSGWEDREMVVSEEESLPAASLAHIPASGTRWRLPVCSPRLAEADFKELRIQARLCWVAFCPVGHLGCSLCSAGSRIALHWRVLCLLAPPPPAHILPCSVAHPCSPCSAPSQ